MLRTERRPLPAEAEVATRILTEGPVSLDELAEVAGYTPRTLARWIREGRLEGCRYNGATVSSWRALAACLAQTLADLKATWRRASDA
jgi:hypothetical protein